MVQVRRVKRSIVLFVWLQSSWRSHVSGHKPSLSQRISSGHVSPSCAQFCRSLLFFFEDWSEIDEYAAPKVFLFLVFFMQLQIKVLWDNVGFHVCLLLPGGRLLLSQRKSWRCSMSEVLLEIRTWRNQPKRDPIVLSFGVACWPETWTDYTSQTSKRAGTKWVSPVALCRRWREMCGGTMEESSLKPPAASVSIRSPTLSGKYYRHKVCERVETNADCGSI